MQKFVLIVMVLLSAAACDVKKSMNPISATSVPTEHASDKIRIVVGRLTNDNQIFVQVYGNLALGLERPSVDLNGGNLRIRDYSTGTLKTYIAGLFNSAPVDDSNVTLYRNLLTGGKVDLALIIEPYGCTSTSCWDHFTFPDMSKVDLHPSNLAISRINIGTSEKPEWQYRLQGPLPSP